jgi:hypothetical protein
MRKTTILIAMLGALFGATASADAGQVRYIGLHPVAKSEGGGICYIEGPHVHRYEADKLQYRDHAGANFFVGDPVAYGYDGPKKAYKGHHPIRVDVVVSTPEPDTEWCYLDGPHFHTFAPPEGPEFTFKGEAYFYVAEPPAVYLEARPAFVGINAIYTPLVYTRPSIVIDAPVGWIGVRPGFGVGVVVGGPAVNVVAPGVVVRGPKVKVKAGIDVRVVVPPPPSVRVNVGVGIGIGGGVKVKSKRGRR